MPDALAALALRHVRRAKIPVGDHLDGDVRLRLADGQGATSGLERRREVAGVHELDRLVVQRATEAALVAGGLRESFGLVEEGPHPSKLAERHERAAEVEAEVEGLGDRVGMLRQPPERVERLLEAGGRLAVGRAQEDLGAGLAQVAHRLVPDLALPRVVRQPLHVLDEAIGVQALDGGRHRGVKIAPALPQETGVGHVVGQRVLEGVLQIREELRLVEELRLLEMREPPPQGLLRLLRDRRQERVRHVLADHRGRLQEPLLLRRQPVDPRRQDRLHRGRHLQRLHRPRQPVRSARTIQRPRLHQRPHRLLQEERVAPLHQHLRQRREPGVRAEQRRQQLRRALGGQGVEPQLGVRRLAAPAVLVLGAVVDQEQEAGGARGSPRGCRAGPGSRRRSSAGPRRPRAAVAPGSRAAAGA